MNKAGVPIPTGHDGADPAEMKNLTPLPDYREKREGLDE